MRILFICKRNDCYGFESYTRRSSGLFNSTRFIVEGLRERGVHADIIEVIDNNCIDRKVKEFKPTVVVIEALWVVPEKFDILKKLHPHVRWFVHLHSDMPFLAMEGIAMDWIPRYAHKNIGLIANSLESFEALSCMRGVPKHLTYLQNVYISHPRKPKLHHHKSHVDIGCFGAVRPLKNQLLQALASLEFARQIGKKLRFHINSSRVETGGQPVLKNIVQLFDHHPEAQLVKSKWNEPEEFLDLLQTMDIGLQVSLTETFNVVTADYVTAGIPIVVSKEVKWASRFNRALDNSVTDIIDKMHFVHKKKCLVYRNQTLLLRHSARAQEAWFEFVQKNRYAK